MSVAMSDHYVLLLENVVKENKALREQIKQMADHEKAVLGDLHKKIDCMQAQNSSRLARPTGPSIRIPKLCKVCRSIVCAY